MTLGGSTNSVLHLLTVARTASANLVLDDILQISNKIPVIINLALSGKYYMANLYDIGGTPSVMKLLLAGRLLDGSTLTVTGKILPKNVQTWPSLPKVRKLFGIPRDENIVLGLRYESPRGSPDMPE